VSTVVVTATGTEVGKTWVTVAVIRRLRTLGVAAHGRKPVQSFTPGDPTTDADELAAAGDEAVDRVCPPHRRLPIAMAPPMAADALGLPGFTIADLVAEIAPGPGLALVESAGGLRSPLADDGDTLDLIAALDPEAVVLVADAGLGTINAVRLCLETLRGFPVLVALNRFDPAEDLHLRNRAWLLEHGVALMTHPAEAADLLR